MIPVRYWLTSPGDLPLADCLDSSNFMFWYPGPDRYFPNDPSKGWAKHTKRIAGHVNFPYACHTSIKDRGAKAFLQRRARQLPRTGGEFLVLVRIEQVYNDLFFSLGLAHYRHRGPTSTLVEFPTWEQIPERVPWVDYGAYDMAVRLQRRLPATLGSTP